LVAVWALFTREEPGHDKKLTPALNYLQKRSMAIRIKCEGNVRFRLLPDYLKAVFVALVSLGILKIIIGRT
jgi:hypothetical protein